jgi:hypothetical protein
MTYRREHKCETARVVTKRVSFGELSVFLRKNKTQQSTPNAESHPSRRLVFFPVFSPVSNRSSPHDDSLFAEPTSGVRSQPAGSPPTPPKSPLQLAGSLLNTPVKVNNPVSFEVPLGGSATLITVAICSHFHVASPCDFRLNSSQNQRPCGFVLVEQEPHSTSTNMLRSRSAA